MITRQLDSEELVNKVYDFIKWRYPQAEEAELKNLIWTHWFYGTMDVIERDGKVIACVRWNVSGDGKVFDVLDLFITNCERGARVMKHFIARNWHRFPGVQFIRFARLLKYPYREDRLYSIKKLLLKRN